MEHRKQVQTANMVERRTFNIEHRATADGVKKIGGMAAVYDSPTNMGWYVEVIKPGFFDGIRTGATACLKNHDANLVLGRTNNNTLKLTFTPSGLDYEAILPKTTIGNDTYEEVSSGYIYQSSFAFTVAEQNWRQAQPSEFAGILDQDVIEKLTYGGVVDVRELIKGADLYDVSPVTYPAYEATSVSSREASPLFEVRNKFLGIEEKSDFSIQVKPELSISADDLVLAMERAKKTGEDEKRMKIKVEVEINEPEKPNGETPDEIPDESGKMKDKEYKEKANSYDVRLRLARARSL